MERQLRCYKCHVPMELTRVDFEARGVLIRNAEGYRCPRCSLEVFTSPQADALEKIIYSLVPRVALTRKISSAAGSKPVVYLPPEILRAVGARIGDKVEISVAGPGRITLELASAEDIEIEASDFPVKKSPARAVVPA